MSIRYFTGLLAGNLLAAIPDRLKVTENHRYLLYESGEPFFYPGDTAWELFHKLNREEAVSKNARKRTPCVLKDGWGESAV